MTRCTFRTVLHRGKQLKSAIDSFVTKAKVLPIYLWHVRLLVVEELL